MPHSKFSEKPAFKSWIFKVYLWTIFTKREEKLKIRLHSKNCLNPPEGFETSLNLLEKDLVKQRRNMLGKEYLKKFRQ